MQRKWQWLGWKAEVADTLRCCLTCLKNNIPQRLNVNIKHIERARWSPFTYPQRISVHPCGNWQIPQVGTSFLKEYWKNTCSKHILEIWLWFVWLLTLLLISLSMHIFVPLIGTEWLLQNETNYVVLPPNHNCCVNIVGEKAVIWVNTS